MDVFIHFKFEPILSSPNLIRLTFCQLPIAELMQIKRAVFSQRLQFWYV
jgi:hypothetical protein